MNWVNSLYLDTGSTQMKSRILIVIAILIVSTACSNKFSLQKRKYRKGYHFEVATQSATKKTQERVSGKTMKLDEVNILQTKHMEPEELAISLHKSIITSSVNLIVDKLKSLDIHQQKAASINNKAKSDSKCNFDLKDSSTQRKYKYKKTEDGWFNESGSFWSSVVLVLILIGVYLIVDSGVTISFLTVSYILGGILLLAFIIALVYLLSERD